MKKLGWSIVLTTAVSFNTVYADSKNITGAGASFPAPVYAKWADTYNKATGVKINYQSIGSSGGIKQINAKTVDFGASDAPLSDADLAKDGLMQFPTVIGGVVVAVNVKGIKSNELVLNGETLGDIYLGKIKNWNDAAIAKLNPNIQLPDQQINVIRRADGSGTTFVFTSYLSKVNASWNKDVGTSTTVKWPVGVGGKGNDGVAAFVQRLPGSIGYVEYAYAKQNSLAYTKLYTADGQIVSPSAESFSAAAKDANWNETFAQDLTHQKGDNAWPITSTTFILLQKTQADAAKANEVLKFFEWAYGNGDKEALALDYAVLPDNVIEAIKKAWATELKDSSGKDL